MENQFETHTKNINITFKLALFTKSIKRTQHKNYDVKWVSIDTFLHNVEPLIDNYISLENPTCCEFKGGFFIDIDGNPWNNEGYVDEFWMTVNWFWALNKLLENGIAKFGPWEQSEMVLERYGDEVLIKDFGLIPCWVPFNDLYWGIIREGYKFADLIDEIKVSVDKRRQLSSIDKNEYKTLELIIEHYDEFDVRKDLDDLSNTRPPHHLE